MGRLLFPDAADAFGYQRTTPNYERTRGMDAYGPQNIAAGIAAAQSAVALGEHIGSEYVKPLAQKVAEYRMAARSKLGIPLTDPDRMKQSFGGLSTMAYGPEGQPRVFDRSQMEPPLRQRKPIVAGGQVVSRPGEIDIQTAAQPVGVQQQAAATPTQQRQTVNTAPPQMNAAYPAQAAADQQRVLMNEYMQLDEAAQNDTGENLPAITARMKAIEMQLQQAEPTRASPMQQLGQSARMNEAALGRLGEMAQARPAWTDRLKQLDDSALIKMGREARTSGRQDLFDAVKAELDSRAEASSPSQVTPEGQILATIDAKVAAGAKLTPNAQAQYDQLKATVAQQQAAQQPKQPQQTQQMPSAGELAPSTAQRGTPQAYAQQLGTQLQEFESTQQAPTYRAPQQEQAQQPLRQNPNGEWEVFVDPKRGHTVTELQALIAAAGRTGRVEDMQKVQQAIMSAPMDDAPPQSWMDIFSEIGGGRGGQRETTRQQLLQQLNQSMPKALSPMDAARLADIESKISGRAQLEDVRVQQEAILREKAANEAERQRMDLENRYLTNKIKEYDSAAKKYGVNSAQAKAVLAEVKAANAQREIDERIRYQRGMVGAAQGQAAAARESARARTKHETHDMQGRGGDINIGGIKNLQKSLPDDWNKANDDRIKAAQIAKDTVPKFGEIVKKYIDYDAAVKANAKLSEAQKKALNDYYSAKDRTRSYYDQMTLLPENAFTENQLKYFKEQTERSDDPTGGSTGF